MTETDLQRDIDALTRTLREHDLMALAAPVAGIDRRLLVLRLPGGEGELRVLADPVVETVGREREAATESCLCLPHFRMRVTRPRSVEIRARTPEGEPVRFSAEGKLARALLHQIDHLEGVLPTERIDRDIREELPDSILRPASRCASSPSSPTFPDEGEAA